MHEAFWTIKLQCDEVGCCRNDTVKGGTYTAARIAAEQLGWTLTSTGWCICERCATNRKEKNKEYKID